MWKNQSNMFGNSANQEETMSQVSFGIQEISKTPKYNFGSS